MLVYFCEMCYNECIKARRFAGNTDFRSEMRAKIRTRSKIYAALRRIFVCTFIGNQYKERKDRL